MLGGKEMHGSSQRGERDVGWQSGRNNQMPVGSNIWYLISSFLGKTAERVEIAGAFLHYFDEHRDLRAINRCRQCGT